MWNTHSAPTLLTNRLTRNGSTTFSRTTLSIQGLNVTLSINDTQSKNVLYYAEYRILFIVMLGVIMMNFVMLSVVSWRPPKQLARGKHS